MKLTDIPSRFPVPFAYDADSPYIRVVPLAPPGGGAASLQQGFPPDTFAPVVAGGIPPAGQDFNGLLNQISAWCRWQAAGGAVPYNADFVAINGGYPESAIISGSVPGLLWLSTADDNTTDPEGPSPANWTRLLGDIAPLNIGAGLTSAGGLLLLANSGVAAATYYPRTIFAVDQYGRVTNAATAGIPIVSRLTATSGNFTPNAATTLLKIRMWGGGGGGAGAAGDGTDGGDTTFGGWTAKGGSKGTARIGGVGGQNGANGTGTLILRIFGNNGGSWIGATTGALTAGGFGGNGPLGGGPGMVLSPTTALAGMATSGSGGGGAPGSIGTDGRGGGGAGEYVEFYMVPTGSPIAYGAGAGGSGGAAGDGNSGAGGGSGFIVVEEF